MCSCKASGEAELEGGGSCGCAGASSGMLPLALATARAQTRSQGARKFLRLMHRVKSQIEPQIRTAFGRRTIDRFDDALRDSSPALTKAGARAARSMFRKRRMRNCVKFLPVIVRKMLISMARRISQGEDVSPAKAVRILARQTRRCLRRGCAETVRARSIREAEGEVSDPAGCLQECERKFQACLNPSWWQFWKTPNPTQCLAERQACQRGCQPVAPAKCGWDVCPGKDCKQCCDFQCPQNPAECYPVCDPYR